MKRFPIFATLLTALLFWSGAGQAKDLQIAVISAAELVQGSPQFKKAEEAMRKEFANRAEGLKKQAEALAEDIKAFQRDRDIMSSAERARKEKELNTRRIDQNYSEQQFNEDLAKRRRDLFNEVLQDISDVIKDVAEEGKYDLVVQDPVYADDSLDITSTVLKRLKSR